MISDESVTISKRGRFWAVHDEAGELICICVYKRGALEVARRLSLEPQPRVACLRETPPAPARPLEESAQIPLDKSHESPERGSRSGAKPTRTTKDETHEEQYRIEERSDPQDLEG
jgi:hypothetical protein